MIYIPLVAHLEAGEADGAKIAGHVAPSISVAAIEKTHRLVGNLPVGVGVCAVVAIVAPIDNLVAALAFLQLIAFRSPSRGQW